MSLHLPRGWATAAVADLGALRLGKMLDRAKNRGQPTKYLRNVNVRWFRFDLDDLLDIHVTPEEACELAVQDGDLFVCEGGEPGRSAVWRGGERALVYQKALHRFRSHGALLPELLMYWLKSCADAGSLSDYFTGTTIKHLTGESFARLRVRVPPLAEQKHIAAKLDSLLARVDACRQRLDRVPGLLKRFRQSVLAAATSGELTREWREERGVGRDGWRATTFESVCREITVGHVGKMAGEYRPEGIPFLRSQNVRPFRFDPRELRYVSREFYQAIRKSSLAPGDVVVVRTGAPGQCCVIPDELSEANCSDLVIVRPGLHLDSRYAAVFINSETSQAFVKSEQVGVAQAHFNVGSMKRAPIELPSLEEQREIARRVGDLFALCAQLEERTAATTRIVAGVAPSVLAKAFRGELVPQDPNNEPAEVMLERVRALRAAGTDEQKPKASRRASPRQKAAPRRGPAGSGKVRAS